MAVAIVTGSAGLIGAAAVRQFSRQGVDVVGVDNDLRRYFFGESASTAWNRQALEREVPGYRHVVADIRDEAAMNDLFRRYGRDVVAVIHAAAQPSHDWAAREPITDFSVNATGTLVLLEATRRHAPEAAFAFLSTNKVYGDTPNHLPLVEHATRFELDAAHPFARHGIDETMSIDGTLHSLFGVSKAAADLLVQEYGRYFGLRTACFRGGCLTGADHSGAELHGFLAYLMQCALTDRPYTVFGHKAKQVRDNIHAADLASALWAFVGQPRSGVVYNMGGGRHSNCSMLEAIAGCERRTGRPMKWSYKDDARVGDHIWWISDTRKFQADYPGWRYEYDLERILDEMHEGLARRLRDTTHAA
ncbi:MAG: NAD-dependent epimerase/dehydratase family protein [Alphaproteobacteria bacterium]|nr:NAD-dependent epimerase/dehydratase family protein [Alphaproteobacteria bacterium]